MKLLPMKSNGHADECMCDMCMALLNDDEPKSEVFGGSKTFRDFVNSVCNDYTPKEAYIYPKFAVLQFEWSTDRKRMMSYLEEHSSDRYTGVHFDDDNEYWAVLIDVTGEGPIE